MGGLGKCMLKKKLLEMRGIEPRAFHMQSERSTTELHPPVGLACITTNHNYNPIEMFE